MVEEHTRSQGDTVRGARQQSLWQSLLWFSGPFGIGLIGFFALNATGARGLGAGFGDFVAVTAAALVMGQLSLCGVHRSGLREAARITDRHDPMMRMLRLDVAAVERLTLAGGAVLTALGAALLLEDELAARISVGVATAALVYLSGGQQLWANYLRGFGEARAAGLIEGRSGGAVVVLSQAAVMACLFVVWGSSMSLASAIAAMAAGYLVPTLVARRRVTRRWHGMHVRSRELPRRLRRLADSNGRFMVTTLTSQVNQYVDLWIAAAVLTAFGGSAFSVSLRLAAMLTLAAAAVQVAFAPAVSRLWGRQDMPQLEQLLRTGASVATVGLVITAVPLLMFPKEVLVVVFGDQYADQGLILLTLTAGSVVSVLSGLCGTALTMSGREGVPAAANSLVLVGRVAVGVPMAMLWGTVGLAASSAAFTVVLNLVLAAAVFRLLKMRTWPTLRPRLRLLASTRA